MSAFHNYKFFDNEKDKWSRKLPECNYGRSSTLWKDNEEHLKESWNELRRLWTSKTSADNRVAFTIVKLESYKSERLQRSISISLNFWKSDRDLNTWFRADCREISSSSKWKSQKESKDVLQNLCHILTRRDDDVRPTRHVCNAHRVDYLYQRYEEEKKQLIIKIVQSIIITISVRTTYSLHIHRRIMKQGLDRNIITLDDSSTTISSSYVQENDLSDFWRRVTIFTKVGDRLKSIDKSGSVQESLREIRISK